jgi:hypothetical protein
MRHNLLSYQNPGAWSDRSREGKASFILTVGDIAELLSATAERAGREAG